MKRFDGPSGAPDGQGQVRAMRAAYAQSGLSPADIGYVECHATGTPVGDGVEIAAMAEVFGADAALPVGSLKSNLGHLITASGAAGSCVGALATGERTASWAWAGPKAPRPTTMAATRMEAPPAANGL